MLKLFVLVIKLNFIVTLSRCYCTSSDSPGLDFIIETVYESLGLCHCTSLSYNSLLPLQTRGPERREEEETQGEGGPKEGYNKSKHFTLYYPDLQLKGAMSQFIEFTWINHFFILALCEQIVT